MQDRKRDTVLKNRLLEDVGEGKGGTDDMREQHRNMYVTICKADDQCKFHA